MHKSPSKKWKLNTLLLLLCLACAEVAFILYSAYIIQNIALHDVYYNVHIYVATYYFLLISLFSLGFFLLPFLIFFAHTFNHKRIFYVCIGVQFISILVLYYQLNFFSLLFSVVGMSLTNVIFVLIILNLWVLAPQKYRFFVTATAYAVNTSILMTFLRISYNHYYYVDNPHFLLLSLFFIALSGLILIFCHVEMRRQYLFHRFTDQLFINIFHLMRHSKVLIQTTLIATAVTVITIYLDGAKFQHFANYISLNASTTFLVVLPINLILVAVICYFASIKNIKTPLFVLLIVLFCFSTGYLFVIDHFPDPLNIGLFYSFIFIGDRVTTFLVYVFIMGVCIDKLLNTFKRS